MKIFSLLYNKIIQWSKHRFAVFWLSLISFMEAIFLPIPPDVMLIPMSISTPNKAFRLALYAAISSVLGGVIGYLIGHYAFHLVQDYIDQWGYQAVWEQTINWFKEWGILVIFVAGFSPVPYKVFTLCAGVMQMAFLPFLLSSIISRFVRFLFVAKLSAWGGEKFSAKLHKFIELIGWCVVFLAVIAYLTLK